MFQEVAVAGIASAFGPATAAPPSGVIDAGEIAGSTETIPHALRDGLIVPFRAIGSRSLPARVSLLNRPAVRKPPAPLPTSVGLPTVAGEHQTESTGCLLPRRALVSLIVPIRSRTHGSADTRRPWGVAELQHLKVQVIRMTRGPG